MLGLIKSERPVAIYVLLEQRLLITPAIAESQISRIPLIVLTGDGVHELRSVGAPQAINQVNMFANYINFQFDMPVADGSQEMLNTINYQMQIQILFIYTVVNTFIITI